MKLTSETPANPEVKTYQYLRIGMVGIVGLLVISLVIEYVRAECFQQSISAYYFTPVRAIFVGGLMAIGAALIFISGRTLAEDVLLSIAGFFAPVVAIIPTTDVGECWSTDPPADPIIDGDLAPWVVAGIRNNVPALLIMGVIGLVVVALLPIVTERKNPWKAFSESATSTKVALGIIALVLLVGFWAYHYWDGFFDHAHGYAAIAMFGFLALAVASNAWQDWRDGHTGWCFVYLAIAAAMVLTFVVVWFNSDGWDHAVLVLEGIEIGLFVTFWGLQTIRLWNRTIEPPDAVGVDDRDTRT
jgi:hypothetical protein